MSADGHTTLSRYLAAVRRRMWLVRTTKAVMCAAPVAAGILLLAGVAQRFFGVDPGALAVAVALLPPAVALAWALLRARPRRLDAARAADAHLGSEGLLVAALDQLALGPSDRAAGAGLVLSRAAARAANATLPAKMRAPMRFAVPVLAAAACGTLLLLAPGPPRQPAVRSVSAPPSAGAVSRAQQFIGSEDIARSRMREGPAREGPARRAPGPVAAAAPVRGVERAVVLDARTPGMPSETIPMAASAPSRDGASGAVSSGTIPDTASGDLASTQDAAGGGTDAAGRGARQQVAAAGDAGLPGARREFQIPRATDGSRVAGGESSGMAPGDAAASRLPVPAAVLSPGAAGIAVLTPRVQAYASRYLSLLAEER